MVEMGSCWVEEAKRSLGMLEGQFVVVAEWLFRVKVFVSGRHLCKRVWCSLLNCVA